MNVIINDNVNKGNLDEALSMVDAAIANKPTAALYNLKGFVLEQKKDEDSALEFYKKAVEMEPENVQAQFNTGRMYMKQAVALATEAEKLQGSAFTKFKMEKLDPLYGHYRHSDKTFAWQHLLSAEYGKRAQRIGFVNESA